jgi:hypothetical protein
MLERIWWMMQVCTHAFGKTASIASGNRPARRRKADQHVADAALVQVVEHGEPELGVLSGQNLAPSVSCHQTASASGSPSTVTPIAS